MNRRVAHPVARWLSLALIGLMAMGGLWLVREARQTTRDNQRQADLAQIQSQLSVDEIAPVALPTALPRDPNGLPYTYRAAGGSFLACAPLEQGNRAAVVTRTGQFVVAQEHCRQPLDPAIATVITDTGMTPAAIEIFLEARPVIADKTTIKAHCAQSGEKVAVYGCYDQHGQIWILQVTDQDLAGLTTVAAVHELLHAVQDKSPPDEGILEAQAAKLNDPVLNDELSLYSAEERRSELHSRLGTEYAALDPPLEAEYAKYFDRAAVIARYQPYSRLFREIQTLQSQLEASKARLERLESAGRISEYNALVDGHNSLVGRYNALANRYNLLAE